MQRISPVGGPNATLTHFEHVDPFESIRRGIALKVSRLGHQNGYGMRQRGGFARICGAVLAVVIEIEFGSVTSAIGRSA